MALIVPYGAARRRQYRIGGFCALFGAASAGSMLLVMVLARLRGEVVPPAPILVFGAVTLIIAGVGVHFLRLTGPQLVCGDDRLTMGEDSVRLGPETVLTLLRLDVGRKPLVLVSLIDPHNEDDAVVFDPYDYDPGRGKRGSGGAAALLLRDLLRTCTADDQDRKWLQERFPPAASQAEVEEVPFLGAGPTLALLCFLSLLLAFWIGVVPKMLRADPINQRRAHPPAARLQQGHGVP